MEVHRRDEKASKINNFWAGFGIAIVIPVIVFILYWYVKYYPSFGLRDYIDTVGYKLVISQIAVCALPDPLVFYFFTKKHYDNACKGMLAVIIILLVTTLVLKLV